MEWIIAGLFGLLFCIAMALVGAQRSEIRYLRRALEEKRDHEHRVERAEVGLPELKVDPPKSDHPPPGVAAAIEDALGAWESPITQEQLRQDIQAWRGDGMEWEWILEQIRTEVL